MRWRGCIPTRHRRYGLDLRRLASLLTVLWLALPACAQQTVQVPSLEIVSGQPLGLTGIWFAAPASAGASAPAMVLLHGCGGMYAGRPGQTPRRLGERLVEVAGRLNAMGIHALALDSLTARGEVELCTQKTGHRAVTQKHRRLDALGALQWLAGQPGVDASRLGLLGWSNGGSTVLAATNGRRPEVRRASVRASLAVAYYPGCESDLKSGYDATARLLMMVGAEDDWTPAAPCEALARTSGGERIDLAVFAGAHHGFDGTAPLRHRKDVPNGVKPGEGVHVGGHPVARQASRERLAEFLTQHWRLP